MDQLINTNRLVRCNQPMGFKWNWSELKSVHVSNTSEISKIIYYPISDTIICKDYVSGDTVYESNSTKIYIKDNKMYVQNNRENILIYKDHRDHFEIIDHFLNYVELYIKDPNVAEYYDKLNQVNRAKSMAPHASSWIFGKGNSPSNVIIYGRLDRLLDKEYYKLFLKMCKLSMEEPGLSYSLHLTKQYHITSEQIIGEIHNDPERFEMYKELMRHLDLFKSRTYMEYLYCLTSSSTKRVSQE